MVKVPEGLRDDLAEVFSQESSLFGSKKSLRVASEALRANERVLAATTTSATRARRGTTAY